MRPLRVATAFSGGFGSVEFALKYLDIEHEVVFACEWMKPQRESYILNHGKPTSAFYEDIRELDGNKYKGKIDYYHLSPPCQSYSLAGKRGGSSDERGNLMFEAIRSISEVRPKMFSIENVRGLLSSNKGQDFKNIMEDLKSTLNNYTISYGIMNAKHQGTPQNRERVFIVGFEGQKPMFAFPQKVELTTFLYDLLEDEVDEKYFLKEKTLKSFVLKESAYKFEPHNRDSKICKCLTARYYKMGRTDPYIEENCVQVGKIGGDKSKKHNSSTNRIYSPCGICPTLTTFSTGGNQQTKFLLENGIRKVTPRECARIMGDFDDKFKMDGFSNTKLYEFIGNAMDINTTKNLISKMTKEIYG